MFLAQIVFSFRPLCLKAIVTVLFWRVREERRSVRRGRGDCRLGVAGGGGRDRICTQAN